MIEKLKILGLASAVAGLTVMASGASALSIFLEDNNSAATYEIIDGGAGDSDLTENGRISENGPFGNFELAATFGIAAGFPPQDKLFGDLTARLLTDANAPASVTMYVSHVFDNSVIAPGENGFSLTQNLNTLGGTGVTETYYTAGDNLYGMGTLLNDISSSNEAVASNSGGSINMDLYTITHVFTITANAAQRTLQASADFIAPVPVPAAGLLLLTALGGMGLASRRRKSA